MMIAPYGRERGEELATEMGDRKRRVRGKEMVKEKTEGKRQDERDGRRVREEETWGDRQKAKRQRGETEGRQRVKERKS